MEGLMMLPPAPDRCPVCAGDHGKNDAHDFTSMHYQFRFNAQHGRSVTAADAVAHLSGEIRSVWVKTIKQARLWTEPPYGVDPIAEYPETFDAEKPIQVGTVETVAMESPVQFQTEMQQEEMQQDPFEIDFDITINGLDIIGTFGCGCKITFYGDSEYRTSFFKSCWQHDRRDQVDYRDSLVQFAKKAIERHLPR